MYRGRLARDRPITPVDLIIGRAMRHTSWETTRKYYAPGNVQSNITVLKSMLSAKEKRGEKAAE